MAATGFLGSSAGKNLSAMQETLVWFLGGEVPGEGIGYPLQYSWASLVVHMVKNPPAVQETWVWSLGWEDPLEQGMATQSSILAWRIPMDRGAWWATVHVVAESDTTEQLSMAQHTAGRWPQGRNLEVELDQPPNKINQTLYVSITPCLSSTAWSSLFFK